ncbi:MAG: DUF3987 domain-containing protein [Planctomycetaceae bacterium]|nr:DUF3987 domain-containing protein [Planctomycetaceae bacterium]
MTLLEAAKNLVASDWSIIPVHGAVDGKCTCGQAGCKSVGKHPVFTGWDDKLFQTVEEVEKHWREHPGHNPAIVTGAANRIVVVDVEREGWDQFCQLQEKFGPLPATRTVLTGGGGWHYYFVAPSGEPRIGNRSHLCNYAIDVRGNGGYVVAPGAVHRTGGEYQWHNPFAAFAEMPGWLYDLVIRAKSEGDKTEPRQQAQTISADTDRREAVQRRAQKYALHYPVAVSEQGGHNRTIGLALRLVRDFALPIEEAYPLIADWNQRCQPPWTEAQLRYKLQEADREDRGWEPRGRFLVGNQESAIGRIPFPVDALPMQVRPYVVEVAASIGCEAEFVAAPVLSVLAAAIGNSRWVQIIPGWSEPAELWTAVIAPSGSGKSPAMKAALAPLNLIERLWRREYEHALSTSTQAASSHQQCPVGQVSGNPQTNCPPAPKLPTLRRIMCGDVTLEKLIGLLSEQPRGLLMAADELNRWISSYSRYQRASDVSHWLSIADADRLIYDRKTGNTSIDIARANVSVTGGIQLRTLAKAMSDAALEENGWFGRTLWTMPTDAKPVRLSSCVVSEATRAAYAALIGQLLQLSMVKEQNCDDSPGLVWMTSGAWDHFMHFDDEVVESMFGMTDGERSIWSKLRRHAARLALVHHVTTLAPLGHDMSALTAESAAAGIALARWFGHEALRILRNLRRGGSKSETEDLIDLIQRKGGSLTPRELSRCRPQRYETPAQAEAKLDELVSRGMGIWVDLASGPKGGRPSKTFSLT